MTDPSSSSKDLDDGVSFHYDADEETQPVDAIVRAVSWCKGVGPTDLEPLHNTVDTDELCDLFSPRSLETAITRSASEGANGPISIKFQYEGCLVEVTPNAVTVEAF